MQKAGEGDKMIEYLQIKETVLVQALGMENDDSISSASKEQSVHVSSQQTHLESSP